VVFTENLWDRLGNGKKIRKGESPDTIIPGLFRKTAPKTIRFFKNAVKKCWEGYDPGGKGGAGSMIGRWGTTLR